MGNTLAGKVALVTGGSRGIGAAIAERLARNGAIVAINYRADVDSATTLAGEIVDAGGHALTIQADLTKRVENHRLVDEVVDRCGGLDILVNNAGVDAFARLSEIDEAHVESLMSLNFNAAIYSTQHAVEAFATKDRSSGGARVINISSIIARTPQPQRSIYAASKAALEAATVAWAAELGPSGITVNAVAPGSIDTDMTRARFVGELRQKIIASTPMGKLGQPTDIANLVSFLASDDAGWITGQIMAVDGGRMDM